MTATVLSRNPSAFQKKAPHLANRPDIEFLAGDVASFAFPSKKSPFIIHAATDVSDKINAGHPGQILDATINGTRRVLEWAAQAGAQKLLLTSSGAVYGRPPEGITRIPETCSTAPDPLIPSSVYGIGKIVSEHLCALAAKQTPLEVKIARCFAVVGPHLPLDTHFAIGNFIRDALDDSPIRIRGDGTPHRSYLYMADLAVWLWTILFNGISSRAYNVGSDHSFSIAGVAAQTNEALGTNCPVLIAQTPRPGAPVFHYVPDTQRARTELGLESRFPLSESIARTIRWIRSPKPTL